MNRLKVAVYVALVLAAGAAGVHLVSRWAAERTLRQMDRDLAAAAGAIQARAPALGQEGLATSEALRGLRRDLGVDVTTISDGRVAQSTLAPGEASLVASAGRDAVGRPASAGALVPQRPVIDLPFPAPALPLLLVRAPAHRVLVLPSPAGADLLAVSQPAAPALAAVVTAQWLGLAALLLLVLAGAVVALLVTDEQRSVLPRELLAAADRMARGDFDARAPVMAGRLGTLAAALNRAAEAASVAAAPRPPAATGAAPLSASSLSGLSPEPARPRAFAPAPEAPSPAAPEPEPLAASGEPAPAEPPLAPDPWSARPEAEAEAEAAPAPAAELASPEPQAAAPARAEQEDATARDFFAAPAGATAFAPAEPPPSPPASAAIAPAPPEAWSARDEDEEHWKATFQDFQRVRAECGESRDGVTYERFREKLSKNRDQLVERYGCRTVRFQVYVKEGKAALKASPVR